MSYPRAPFVLLAAFLASAAAAQPAAQPAKPIVIKPGATAAPHKSGAALTPRTISPAVRSNMLAKIGGMISAPAKGPALLYLNTQTRVPAEAVSEPAVHIGKVTRLPYAVRAQPAAEPVAEAVKAAADANVAAVVVIADTTSYPALLLAPESRWALVNVAALGGAGVSPEALADRTQKEIARAVGMLMGAAYSTQEACVLRPVRTPADLDALKAKTLSVEPLNKIMMCAQHLGMQPTRRTTYRKAVEEGWAPAPTNDVQRAIWQELKK
jgi:predicted Zn-dependent protease